MSLVVKLCFVLEDVSALSSMPDMQNTAKKTPQEGDDRRTGARDRRIEDKERRDSERVAEEIAPRRHPDLKGRRTTDS